ncbi:MAG: SDR family NAD(P)-dependent oxidoreductase [Chloroflexi bacterium]|nr:SDR family NAD(P)-dependent oxidoreductase [Chloroflexota bacterium]
MQRAELDGGDRPMLAGQTALVTGGGRGLGRAICMALAREGANIVVVARTESEIERTARMVETDTGASALPLRCDAADESQVESAASQAIARFGTVDILVNNHGVIRGSPVWKTPIRDWDEVIAINLRGAFLFVRGLVPSMIERRRGVIVGVSSTAGLRGYQAPTAGAYVASKAGLIAFDQQLAESVRDFNIRVFTICPGPISDTGMGPGSPPVGQQPNPRYSTPEEIAAAVSFMVTSLPIGASGRVWDMHTPPYPTT